MKGSSVAWTVGAFVVCSGVGLASARPPKARGRSDRPVFQGQRAPSSTETRTRERVKRRRGTSERRGVSPTRKTNDRRTTGGVRGTDGGRRGGPTSAPGEVVSPSHARSATGKLAYTYARARRWHQAGIYLSDGAPFRVDLTLDGVQGQHLLMKCDLTTLEDGMTLVISRPGGPTIKQTFDKVGHRFVTFNIANAPATTTMSLHMEDLPGVSSGTKWMLYACRMQPA